MPYFYDVTMSIQSDNNDSGDKAERIKQFLEETFPGVLIYNCKPRWINAKELCVNVADIPDLDKVLPK